MNAMINLLNGSRVLLKVEYDHKKPSFAGLLKASRLVKYYDPPNGPKNFDLPIK